MASFLSKVFPRKKEKDASKRASVSSLLEGKFEAVSPTVSPSAAKFEEDSQNAKDRGRSKEKEKEKERDTGFSLFRTKSRPLSPPPDTRKTVLETPRLTLNLPVPKEERSRALGVVFEGDPDDRIALPDNVIGERRLNPLEALLLVKACSSAIIANGGLETLGVMHPFWYSASPEVQRKLISLFILSLAPKSPITTLSPSPNSALSTFDTELVYTRSPHDIAAVLRWALRHLRLEGESFGRVDEPWKWYQVFSEAERTSSYATNAFSDALAPQLPPSHLQLLIATLDIVSSLAAHSEHNGISGSKLTKFFGLWLLTAQRSEQTDDWASFYARWERAGRILEHLFLAHIRDEMARKKIPLRLAELVKGYPYHNRSPSADSAVSVDTDLLPRPRLSTRQYDALYVRVDTEIVDGKSTKQKQHPLRLISDALKSDLELTDAKFASIWETVKTAALANDEPEPILSHVDGYPSVSRIFADETIRLLSVIPAGSSGPTTPGVPTIRVPRPPRKRSGSLKSSSAAKGTANGNGKAPTNGTAVARTAATPTSPNPPSSPKDWVDFSSAGFGESTLGKDFVATLLDKDVEVTAPRPVVERKTSRKRKASPGRSRGNSVATSEPEPSVRAQPLSPVPAPKSKSTIVSMLKLDEAFIDFWSDALLDPVSADWPNFVVAQLKALPGLEIDGKPISWLVLEQRYVTPPPPPAPVSAESQADTSPPLKRASSPRPSMRSEMSARKSATLAAARKRLTFFSSSQTLGGLASKAESKAPARKKAKPTRIGEMGEIISEDDGAEKKPEIKEPEKEEAKTAGPAPKETAPAPPADAPKVVEAVVAQPEESAMTTTPAASESAVAPSPVPPIVPAPASPAIDALSPLTPTADDFPAVPVVGGLLASATAATTLAVVEPLKTEDAQTEDTPVLAVAEQPIVPADTTPTAADADADADAPQETTLPPAPEPVVLTGETPGPQVALSTSEPAALAELSTKIDEVVAQAASEPELEKLPSTLNPEVAPVEPEVEQTTEAIPEEVVVEEEVVPSAAPAEAPAVVQEAALEGAEEETSVVKPATKVLAVAPEVEVPAAAAEVEAPAAMVEVEVPAVEAEVQAPAPAVAAVSEATEAAAPAEPEAVTTEAPDEVAEVLSEPSLEQTPAVEEPLVEETPVVEEAAVVEEAPVAEETPVVEEAVAVEEAVPAEYAPVLEEPAVEPVEVPAAPEPVEEEVSAPIEESTPAAVEEPAEEPVAAAVEEPAAEFEAPATQPELPEESETLIAAEPEAAAEPETVIAEAEPEVPSAPEPQVEALTEQAPVPAAAVDEPVQEEEAQLEETPAVEEDVVEDVVAPAAEEVAVEPAAEEPTAPEAEEPAVTESAEVPAAEPEPTPEESPVADAPVHEEPAAEPEVAPVLEEPVAAPEPATIDEPQATTEAEIEAPTAETEEALAAEAEEAPAAVEPEVEQTPAVAEEVTAEERAPAVEEAPVAPQVEASEAPAQPAVEEPAEIAQPEAVTEPEVSEEPEVAEKPENGTVHAEVKTAEDAPAAVEEDAVVKEEPAGAEASSD